MIFLAYIFLHAVKIWTKHDYAKEIQLTIYWSLIEVIYFILGWEEKGGLKQVDAMINIQDDKKKHSQHRAPAWFWCSFGSETGP